MNVKSLHKAFKSQFDIVGVIKTKTYLETAKTLKLTVPQIDYPTIVVLGLAYPKHILSHSKTHLVPSIYTFGMDYHEVLKSRIDLVMKNIPYDYLVGVDNHPHNERLAAKTAGIGFFGKNQLIINSNYGSYIFLGMVFIDLKITDEYTLKITDDCGECTMCIDACPTNALSENGYDKNKCISYYNQTKKVLTDKEIENNNLLFGCDICQLVCPKNIEKGKITHPEFELSGKELVSIVDLFTKSNKEFNDIYSNMAYLWKGKTILMRNALTILLKQNNQDYNELIKSSIAKYDMPWYKEVATKILKKLSS
ncbi:MAG: epoxyqueuosine reductase [Bacillota bacterium]